MRTSNLKEHLLKIAENITSQTTLEQVYEQLALLADIDQAEEDIAAGEFLTQEEVEKASKEWLK